MQKTLDKFIKEICKELNIPIPTISFDTSGFTSDTMIAQYSSAKNVIYIKKFEEINFDILFAVTHELRHIWQIRTSESFYMNNYTTSISVEDYNRQIAEIDANAYAGLVMINLFGVKPLFHGLPSDIVEMIYNRMEEIEDDDYEI